MNISVIKERGAGQSCSSRSFLVMIFACIISLFCHATCFATTVDLQWDPVADTALIAGYKIYFRADSAVQPFPSDSAVLVDKAQTSATISGLDPIHSYYFVVVAYDASGAESSYSKSVYVPRLSPPIISITSPVNNATVSAGVPVTVSASDSAGVSKVEFYINDASVPIFSDTVAPYSFNWLTTSLDNGNYTLTAKAFDSVGNLMQTSDVLVTVLNAIDFAAPTVTICARKGASTASGTLTVTATANDDVGVSMVEYFVDGVLVPNSQTSTAPYTFTWDLRGKSDKSYYLVAKAYDAAGNIGQSAAVMMTVPNCILK